MKTKNPVKKKTFISKVKKTTGKPDQKNTIWSTKEAIKHGWKQAKGQFRKFTGVILIIGIMQMLISGISQYLGIQMGFGADVGYRPVDFIGSIIGMRLGLGFTAIAIHAAKGESREIKTLFSKFSMLGKYIISYILMGCCIVIGLILFILPGIYIAYRLSFMQYFIVDKNSGPIQALKQSRYASKGHFWKLVGLSLLFVLINILGFLALGIGLLRTIPTTVVAYAYVYEQLK